MPNFALGIRSNPVPADHAVKDLAGVYYRWYDSYYRRLQDRIFLPVFQDGEKESRYYSQLEEQVAERLAAQGRGSYSKLGTLALGWSPPFSEKRGYVPQGKSFVRPEVLLRYEEGQAEAVVFEIGAGGEWKRQGCIPAQHLDRYRVTPERGWLATNLDRYWSQTRESERAAGGKADRLRECNSPSALWTADVTDLGWDDRQTWRP